MTKNETRLWIDYHASVFSDWKYSAGSKEAKAIAFNTFAKALLRIDLEDAKEATDRMAAGTIKKPFRDEDHLAAIVAACKQIQTERWAEDHPRTADGERTVSCRTCRDTGFVFADFPADAVHETMGWSIAGDKYTYPCKCDRGRRLRDSKWGRAKG